MHAFLIAAALSGLAPQGDRPAGAPKHRPEEYEYMFQETGFVLPQNAFEADLTVSRLEFDEFRGVGGAPDVEIDQLTLELAYGVTSWLMVEAELPFLRVDVDPGGSESGIGDIALEGKASLKSMAGNPIGFIPDVDIAAGARVTLPTGDEDEGLGQEDPTLSPFVSGSYWIRDWVAVHARVLVEWQQDVRPVHRFNATGEFVPWMKELSLMGGLQIERVGSDSSAVLLVPGAEYRFPQTPLVLGASIPLGLNDKAADFGIVLNAQFGF